MPTLTEVRIAALRSLTPPPRLRLSSWIEQTIRLPEGISALPGRVRLWPYQIGVCEAISDPVIERVSVQKAARVGYTILLNATIGAFAVNEPSSILLLEPTESDCRDAAIELDSIFEASPDLRNVLTVDVNEQNRNTMLFRRFPGGSLKIVASRAPRNLRRHSARILLADEVDGMDITPEGDPLRLAERRTLTFPNCKLIAGSTPVYEDTSAIARLYADSDARIYECPCPSCGSFAEITWSCIEWQPDRPDTAAWRCPSCKELVPERYKAGMVQQGQWRATQPHVVNHAGFKITALISLHANAAWGRLAQEFLLARDDPSLMQPFANTVLAEPWRSPGTEIDEGTLAARAEPFGLDSIPVEVLVITAGHDLQDDRSEITVVGWTREGAVLILGHFVIWGSPDDQTLWMEVDELLKTKWKHPLGGRIGIDACAIDSGDGQWTQTVYDFAFPRASRRVMAIKGMGGTRPAIQVSKGKIKGGGRLWVVGTDVCKTTIFNRLQRGQSIRFSNSLEPTFYEQLAAEKKVVRYSKGRPIVRFERIPGRRAEALDCVVYAWAARSAVPVQLDHREASLHSDGPSLTAASLAAKLAGKLAH